MTLVSSKTKDLLDGGCINEADALSRHAVETMPTDGEAWKARGLVHMARADEDKARQAFMKYFALTGENKLEL